MPELPLPGCTPEPLMSYLKALGILRLVSEDNKHGDSNATGCWRNDQFVLCSKFDENGLVAFFLNEYQPTPLVAPWGARSGFYTGSAEKTARQALDTIRSASGPRFHPYQQAIACVRDLLRELGIKTKAKDEDKLRLMQACRSTFPEHLLDWLDTCFVLTADNRKFPPLLGTGGNEGSGSYVSGFAQLVVSCLIDRSHDLSLKSAIFGGAHSKIASNQTPGHFSPTAAGGPNATQGMNGPVTTNPWDYLLCMEGACLWASSVVRRCGDSGRAMASFPFTVNVSGAGATSLDETDSRKPKQAKRLIAEMWLPIWSRLLSLKELTTLLSEGRATIGRRIAATGTDMARAVAGLGIDRGIDRFDRIAFLMRNGQSFLALPLGSVHVQRQEHVDLLRQVDPWFLAFEKRCATDDTPVRFRTAKRRIEGAIFDYCRYGRREDIQAVLIALGRAERELAITAGQRGGKEMCRPLARLSPQWLQATHDGTTEFDIALALAGIYERENKIENLRANLEPVALEKGRWSWQEAGPHVVWNNADLTSNMAAVIARRMMDGTRAGCDGLPLDSRRPVSLDHVAAFIASQVDDRRIEELLWGLILINHRQPYPRGLRPAPITDVPPLPREYALLKLLFLPRPPARSWDNERQRWNWQLATSGEQGMPIRPEPRVLPLLRSGRVAEACRIAYTRLRSSGFKPFPYPMAGQPIRDREWEHVPGTVLPQRLAAALLLSIGNRALNSIIHLVTRQDEEPDNATLVSEGASDS